MASTTASSSLAAGKTGAGTTVDFLTAKSLVSMVVIAKGTVTGGVVAVEASHDGTNWVQLHAFAPSTGINSSFDLTRGAYRYYRANILSDITGGGSVDATLMEGN